ncbi:MAG: phospholipid carrier-dependent glycosyltransferase [Microbacterium sp.]|nr:phospholipid carrier-dependent glycosyltransferase [Microbacterium sp.]
MTTTVEPLLPATRPSFYDRWASRVRADPAIAQRIGWLAPVLVTLLAGILRFWNLGDPHAIVFDETYYVKDAWSQWNLGYPANWPDGADPKFLAGQSDIFLKTGSFVVHPPLGKWIIGAGMWLFGPDSTAGWRFSVALFGTATVLVLYLVAKSLTRSTVFATVAAFLMAIDGLAIVLSRVALLDGILTFFLLLAFWFAILDRERHVGRLERTLAARAEGAEPPAWGPFLWGRPWLLAAGAAAGAATAVKWSGLYVIAAIGIYAVVSDALARRRGGVRLWPADALRQAVPAFLALVPIALVVYLFSWTGWFLTSGGYDRHAADLAPATGFWSWVPRSVQSLWIYHQAMYQFHIGLTTPHSYASPAWQWPMLVRPTSMYWHQDKLGEAGCTAVNSCVQAISSIPNPLIWWAGIAAAIYLVYAFAVRRDWRYAIVLTGVAATYLPWLMYPERTIFQFYTVAMLPFTILALAFALREIARGGHPRTPPDLDEETIAELAVRRRTTGQRVVLVFLVVVTLLSAFWYPVWTAWDVPYDYWRLHNWLPTWV